MPWIKDPETGLEMHICVGRTPRKRCAFCGALCEARLCDAPAGLGDMATCDAVMCYRCATPAGNDIDYCPNHVEVPVMAEWKYKTQDDLRAAGYAFKNETRCIPCETTIEWWRTPAGKFMPLNYHTAQPHWITCKDPNRFRRKASGADVDEIARCGDHACAAIGCKATVPAKYLMCLAHWRQVPEPLAKALYDQFHRCLRNRVPLVTDPAYMAARQACINIVAKKEGVRTA